MNTKIPQDSIVYLLVCLSGLVIFIILGIVPSQRTMAELEEKIADMNLRTEEQKALFPIYQSLNKRARTVSRKLPLPNGEPVSEQSERIMERIKETAARAGVGLVSIVPNITALTTNPGHMALEVTAKGDIFSFRRFLIGLGGLNQMEQVEEIQIQQNPDAMEFKLKLWIVRGQVG